MIGGADAWIVWGVLLDDAPAPEVIAAAARTLGVDPDELTLGALLGAWESRAREGGADLHGRPLVAARHGSWRWPQAWAIGVEVAATNSKAAPALVVRPEVYLEAWRPVVAPLVAALGARSEVDGCPAPLSFHLVAAVE